MGYCLFLAALCSLFGFLREYPLQLFALCDTKMLPRLKVTVSKESVYSGTRVVARNLHEGRKPKYWGGGRTTLAYYNYALLRNF